MSREEDLLARWYMNGEQSKPLFFSMKLRIAKVERMLVDVGENRWLHFRRKSGVQFFGANHLPNIA